MFEINWNKIFIKCLHREKISFRSASNVKHIQSNSFFYVIINDIDNIKNVVASLKHDQNS